MTNTSIFTFGVHKKIIRTLCTSISVNNINSIECQNKIDSSLDEIAVIFSDLNQNTITPILLSEKNKFIYKSSSDFLNTGTFIITFFDSNSNHILEKYDLDNISVERIQLDKKTEVFYILAEDKIFLCQTDDNFKIICKDLINFEEYCFDGNKDYVISISVSPQNNILLSTSKDKTLRFWSIKDQKCIETVILDKCCRNISILDDSGNFKVIGWGDKSNLWIWDFKNKKYILNESKVCPTTVSSYKINKDELIFIGKPNGIVDCFSVKEKKYIWSNQIHSNWVHTIKLCRPQNTLLTSGEDGTICIVNIFTGKIQHKLFGHEGGVWNIICIKNVLITSGLDETIRIWNLNTNNCHAILAGHVHKITQMLITTDKNYLISLDKFGYIFAWEADWNNFF